MSSPWYVIRPPVTGTSPAIALRNVVFPDPFAPKTATISPGRASIVTARTARTCPNRTVRFLTLRCMAVVVDRRRGHVLRQVGGVPLPGDAPVLDRHDAAAHLFQDERVVGDEEEGCPGLPVEGVQEGGELRLVPGRQGREDLVEKNEPGTARYGAGELEPAQASLGQLGGGPEPLRGEPRPLENHGQLLLDTGGRPLRSVGSGHAAQERDPYRLHHGERR